MSFGLFTTLCASQNKGAGLITMLPVGQESRKEESNQMKRDGVSGDPLGKRTDDSAIATAATDEELEVEFGNKPKDCEEHQVGLIQMLLVDQESKQAERTQQGDPLNKKTHSAAVGGTSMGRRLRKGLEGFDVKMQRAMGFGLKKQ